MGEPDLITFGIVCVATLKNISVDYLTYIYLKLNWISVEFQEKCNFYWKIKIVSIVLIFEQLVSPVITFFC